MPTRKPKRGERTTDSAQKKTTERVPMSVAQVAEYTGWSRFTVYSKINKHELPYYKPLGSNRVFFDKADIDKVIFGNRIASNSEIQERAAEVVKGGLII